MFWVFFDTYFRNYARLILSHFPAKAFMYLQFKQWVTDLDCWVIDIRRYVPWNFSNWLISTSLFHWMGSTDVRVIMTSARGLSNAHPDQGHLFEHFFRHFGLAIYEIINKDAWIICILMLSESTPAIPWWVMRISTVRLSNSGDKLLNLTVAKGCIRNILLKSIGKIVPFSLGDISSRIDERTSLFAILPV
jgi:hypothetical protein